MFTYYIYFLKIEYILPNLFCWKSDNKKVKKSWKNVKHFFIVNNFLQILQNCFAQVFSTTHYVENAKYKTNQRLDISLPNVMPHTRMIVWGSRFSLAKQARGFLL